MKLTISTLACPDWPIERIVAAVREYGIAGISFRGLGSEIDITKLLAFTVHLPLTMAMFRDAGLSIPCLCTSVTLLSPPGDRWEAMLEECQRYAQLAEHTGTQLLRIFGGKPPRGLPVEEALLMARRRLRQVMKICRKVNCKPVVETHDDWAMASSMMRLVEGMDADDVGVLWDMEHSIRPGEPPEDSVRLLGKFLAHVHVKDSVRTGQGENGGHEKFVPALLGEGDLPLERCVRALVEAKYDDWICLDTEKRWFAEAPEPEKSIPHFAAYMRKLLGSVAK